MIETKYYSLLLQKYMMRGMINMTIEDIYDMIRDNEKKLDKILELLEREDDDKQNK
jgi:hypothetical protein